MRGLLIAPIRFYQRHVSPMFPRRCKYHPTCSEYAVGAVREFGAWRGTVLATWRLLRCNPWSRGGVDYPHDQRLFRS
ncbi:MAG TPA: membrane protein insertion efficiency factor YidD [Miltoncostaeaceae bacterium]|nr:membrane protein insertion efficiency factor YidD [Miltoncostaeaceae bacterium]